MRIIFLILCLWVPIMCISQDDKPPTQKEIEAQKQEAIKEAKQQVADLKKDIADAKANKEDPESIKEMEKQLATLENMVAMLEKTSLSGKQRPLESSPTKTVEPKYVSPFTPIGLKQPVSIPTEKEATDQLFWYRGKKIDANTLITTSGMIVRYDRANNKLIFEPSHKPGPDTTHSYYGLLHTLKQTRQMKNLFVSQVDGMLNSFFMYPQIQGAYDEFDMISERYYDVARNTFEFVKPAVRTTQLIEDLDKYVKSLPGINNVILPPRRPECFCDTRTEIAKYHKELVSWLTNFFKEEDEILYRVDDIFYDIERSMLANIKASDFKHEQYLGTAFQRTNRKLELLLNEYTANIDNVFIEDALVYAKQWVENKEREHELKTMSNVPGSIYFNSQKIFDEIKQAVFSGSFDDYIYFHKNLKHFSAVFDHGLYVNHEYNKRLLSPGYNVNTNIQKWLESLKDYNRFTLTIKVEFEYEQQPGNGEPLMTATGEFQSDKIIVSLGVEDCFLFNLRITDANYRDRNVDEEKLKIPLAFKKGEKQYANQQPIPYSGPSNAMMLFPRFKLDFCGGESEVKLDLLTYTDADVRKHQSDDPKKVFTLDMLAYANKMFLGLVKTQSNADDLINTAGKMMDMRNALLPQSTGNRQLDEMRMDCLMNQKRYDLLYHLAATSHTEKTIVKLGKLTAQGPMILSNPIDLFDPNDKDKVVKITYAYITLELTHTPK